MSGIFKLHNQDLTDVMVELDRSNDPRSRLLHDLAESSHVYPLNEVELGPLRRAGKIFQKGEWSLPILTDQLPLDTAMSTQQIKRIFWKEMGGKNTYQFAPSYGAPEKDAQAIVELLNNIHDPHYNKLGSILHMQSPTFERLCKYKPEWDSDGVLYVSEVCMSVTPAGGVEDLEFYNNYSLSTLLTGTKVWLVFPPYPGNFPTLQAEYEALTQDPGRYAMDNSRKFERGIAFIQQAGQALILPPFWIAASISTQTAVSCTYHITTATVFADRIKYLHDYFLSARLWPADYEQSQRRVVEFATEFLEHLQKNLANKFPHCNVANVISEICRNYETLRTDLRRTLDAIEDKAVVRGFENKYRATWLKLLEEKRKKSPACRLCNMRVQNMPAGGNPTDRLRQHFVNSHCLRSERTIAPVARI